jgi:hypothetical protein
VLRRTVAVAVLVACVEGCSVSVVSSSDNLLQEAKYDALWSADWTRIAIDYRPMQATASSPGVCNIGGSKQGCYDADLRTISGFRRLASDLSGAAVVPPEFARANTTLHRGIADYIQGLSERDEAIASQNPDASLGPSNKELALAQQVCEKALSEYHGLQLPPNPFK